MARKTYQQMETFSEAIFFSIGGQTKNYVSQSHAARGLVDEHDGYT